jgi:hypothetical protein
MPDLEVIARKGDSVAGGGAGAAQPSQAEAFWRMTCERWLRAASQADARYALRFGEETCAGETT